MCVRVRMCTHVCPWACVCWELCCKGALLPHSSHFCSDLLDKDTHAPPGCGTSQPAGLWSFSELGFPPLPSCSLRVQWRYCVSLSLHRYLQLAEVFTPVTSYKPHSCPGRGADPNASPFLR